MILRKIVVSLRLQGRCNSSGRCGLSNVCQVIVDICTRVDIIITYARISYYVDRLASPFKTIRVYKGCRALVFLALWMSSTET
jgi:hypothetical protein